MSARRSRWATDRLAAVTRSARARLRHGGRHATLGLLLLAAVTRSARARLRHGGRHATLGLLLLAAVTRTAQAPLRHGARRTALVLLLLASLGAWAGASAGAPALASGEAGGSPGETGTSPTGTGTSNCPSSNPPNQMTLVAGTPQTATLETAFASGLQVALTNSDGCAVTGAAGIPVTFTAPASGASGVFSTSASNTAIVGADASGTVAAPPLTANGTPGSYTVTASSQYGSVSFSLTNTAVGVWCSTLGKRVSTAGEPAKLTAGVGATQSTLTGTPFPIRLAVTVTDAHKNPVPGALITFSAPLAGASGRFTIHARGPHHRPRISHPHTVKVKTGACGIAVAPVFTANNTQGGYIVKATVEHAAPAAFALVNAAPGQSS
jgi:hypothetical protein